MAKKQVVLDSKHDIIENLSEFTKLRNVDRATLMSVLEEVFRSMIRKKYGSDDNYNVIVNIDKGDLQVFRERVIVEDALIEDENQQITLSEALMLDSDYEVGDEVAEVVSFNEFGMRQILAAKQLLAQKIKELEKAAVINEYKALIGEIIVGEVYQIWRNEILVMHADNELILPKNEQIPKDRYKKGDTIRAVVHDVQMRNSNPRIIISRSSPVFLERLFEREVPEIEEGTIMIRDVVREPGERAKVAVESYDERVDPVGACVGMRGTRIHGIVRELRNENIDVINYTSNMELFIHRSLTPARPTKIEIDEDTHRATVFISSDQVSQAIGKGGINVKLASKLTKFSIDIFREDTVELDEEDVDLEEFTDEIDEWIINELKAIGCDSAKSVLLLTEDEIERRTDLDRETIIEVLEILKSEFED